MAGTAFADVLAPRPPLVRIHRPEPPNYPRITRGVSDFEVTSELYVLEGDLSRLHLLAEAGGQPALYVHRWRDGKVHDNQFGHDARALGHPGDQRLVVQAVQWALGPAE